MEIAVHIFGFMKAKNCRKNWAGPLALASGLPSLRHKTTAGHSGLDSGHGGSRPPAARVRLGGKMLRLVSGQPRPRPLPPVRRQGLPPWPLPGQLTPLSYPVRREADPRSAAPTTR